MNKRQKMQVALGVISSVLGILSMALSYRAEEKNKKKSE